MGHRLEELYLYGVEGERDQVSQSEMEESAAQDMAPPCPSSDDSKPYPGGGRRTWLGRVMDCVRDRTPHPDIL